MPRNLKSQIVAASFARPVTGVTYTGSLPLEFECTGGPAWQSNGGANRGHPARSLPFTLDSKLSQDIGVLVRLHLLGIFALYAGREEESTGTLGASLQLVDAHEPRFRQDLLNGRHYSDGRNLQPLSKVNGDGTSVQTVGTADVDGVPCRVDLLSVDLPPNIEAETLRLKDLGSPASFAVFDVFLEHETAQGCPFHSKGGGISLSEIGSVVRVGDRVRFQKALDQLESSLEEAEDLDEARGQALTFLAVVTAATLEMGGSRAMHRVQLETARLLDTLTSKKDIARVARNRVEEVSGLLLRPVQSPSSYLVDRALSLVDRNFAKDLTDSSVATQLGLSTSHFRFLFKEATGQPFHKYLIALRLEKARQMLVDQDLPVSEVARAVGFGGLSHFSRAFAQRFSVSPTNLRRGVE